MDALGQFRSLAVHQRSEQCESTPNWTVRVMIGDDRRLLLLTASRLLKKSSFSDRAVHGGPIMHTNFLIQEVGTTNGLVGDNALLHTKEL